MTPNNFNFEATWEIEEAFRDLEPFLIGTPRHFYVDSNNLYCFRTHVDRNQHPCTGCPYREAGCEVSQTRDFVQLDPVPHSRRGVGLEEREFLVLDFLPDQSFSTLPQEISNLYAEKSLDEANLHWALTDPDSAILHVLKGQIRFYGGENDFSKSPYPQYFKIVDHYLPQHRIVSLDFSAIEPRVSTLVTKQPNWIEVFAGSPKVISREITISGDTLDPVPEHIFSQDGKQHCFLKGEMDKEVYEDQCQKCTVKDRCSIQQDHYKNVALDWHSLNCTALYGSEFTEATDKFVKKGLRDIAKIVGLALLYGGSAWTVSRNMHTSVEEAQRKIDNFFANLSQVRDYVMVQKAGVRQTGKVLNLFRRIRDVSRWSHSQAATDKERRSDRGYAERTSLNHPIQSTASELLKIAMIRVVEYLQISKANPLAGLALPQILELRSRLYDEMAFSMLSSVHDELVYLGHDRRLNDIIPPIYTTMQLSDVMSAFQAGFTLELDCEYDPTRSWTSSKKFHTAKIYLLNRLNGAVQEGGESSSPNLFIFQFSDLNKQHLESLSQFVSQHTPSSTDISIGVVVSDTMYLHPCKLPASFLEAWGLEYKKAVLTE